MRNWIRQSGIRRNGEPQKMQNFSLKTSMVDWYKHITFWSYKIFLSHHQAVWLLGVQKCYVAAPRINPFYLLLYQSIKIQLKLPAYYFDFRDVGFISLVQIWCSEAVYRPSMPTRTTLH